MFSLIKDIYIHDNVRARAREVWHNDKISNVRYKNINMLLYTRGKYFSRASNVSWTHATHAARSCWEKRG